MNKDELLWASGLFEGEGWISIQNSTPCLGIQSCDKEVLERVQAAVGEGNIYHRKPRVYDYEKIQSRKEQWAWRVGGIEKVEKIIDLLWYGLSTRRRERAKEVLTTAKERRQNSTKKVGRPSTPSKCGEVQSYWRGCRCVECKQASCLYNKELRERRESQTTHINRTYTRRTA